MLLCWANLLRKISFWRCFIQKRIVLDSIIYKDDRSWIDLTEYGRSQYSCRHSFTILLLGPLRKVFSSYILPVLPIKYPWEFTFSIKRSTSIQQTPAYKNMWIKKIRLRIGQLNTIYIRTNSAWKIKIFLFKKKEDTRKR